MENQLNHLPIGEQAEIERERTMSDAQLLEDNAEYRIDENGDRVLVLTKDQIEVAKMEMEGTVGLREKFIENCLVAMENLENFDHVFISGKSDFEYSSPFTLEKQEDGEYLLKNIKTNRDCAEGPYELIFQQKRNEEKRELEPMLGKYWDNLGIDDKKDIAGKDVNSLFETKKTDDFV